MFEISGQSILAFVVLLSMTYIARSRGWGIIALLPLIACGSIGFSWVMLNAGIRDHATSMSPEQAMQAVSAVATASKFLWASSFVLLSLMCLVPRQRN